MDIPDKHILHLLIADVLADSLRHASSCPVRECQTQHIVVCHSMLFMSNANPFCQYLRLPTPWRGEHKMVATIHTDDTLLALIRGEFVVCQAFHSGRKQTIIVNNSPKVLLFLQTEKQLP